MILDTGPHGIAYISAEDAPERKTPANTVQFLKANKMLAPVLKQLNYDRLRPGQDRAVYRLFYGMDTLCVLPTGGGKSAIYIIPSLCVGMRTVIFSPLVSLMQDQVESLWRCDLSAAQISSAQTLSENDMAIRNWEAGDIQFLLVSPERQGNEKFMNAMFNARPNMVVVDEAHCWEGRCCVSTKDGRLRLKDMYQMFESGQKIPDVLSYDLNSKVLDYKRVTNVWRKDWKPIWKIDTDGNNSVRSSGDHLWYTDRCWVAAQSIRPGDMLLGVNAGERQIREPNAESSDQNWNSLSAECWHKVTYVGPVNQPKKVRDSYLYDIEVESNHNVFVHSFWGNNSAIVNATAFLAHNCLSQWSDNFRPSYAKIGSFIATMKPDVVLCLTATATSAIEEDIRSILRLENAKKIMYYPKRDNLILSSVNWRDENQVLQAINASGGPTVVYCLTRKKCEELYNRLSRGIEGGALFYHGGMNTDERSTNQKMFMTNETRVMFATNAFGLGVNKADIRAVLHREAPISVEALAQEMGRAGRDGLPSLCTLFHDPASFETNKWFISTQYPSESIVERVFYCLSKNLDRSGVAKIQISRITQELGLRPSDDAQIGAAISILTRFEVIKRDKDAEEPVKVRLLKPHIDDKFQGFMDSVKQYGSEENGYILLNFNFFLEQTGLKQKKARDTFKLLDQSGYLQYTPAYRGSTTSIIGDLTKVDFNRLENRHQEALKKLAEVRRYIDTPDAGKHDFLLRYFDAI